MFDHKGESSLSTAPPALAALGLAHYAIDPSYHPVCSIATLAVASNMRELYRLVLVDTPLAPYFAECVTSEVRRKEEARGGIRRLKKKQLLSTTFAGTIAD